LKGVLRNELFKLVEVGGVVQLALSHVLQDQDELVEGREAQDTDYSAGGLDLDFHFALVVDELFELAAAAVHMRISLTPSRLPLELGAASQHLVDLLSLLLLRRVEGERHS